MDRSQPLLSGTVESSAYHLGLRLGSVRLRSQVLALAFSPTLLGVAFPGLRRVNSRTRTQGVARRRRARRP